MEIVVWFLIAVLMAIGLPLYFGLKFNWDPATVELEMEDNEFERATEESP